MLKSTATESSSFATIAEPEAGGVLSLRHAELLEEKRKISPEVATKYGVFSQGKNIGFSYAKNGKLYAKKIRTPEKDFRFDPAGQPLILWNVDCLEMDPLPDEFLILTEGEFDALSCLEAGYRFVVSVPNGAPGELGKGDIDPKDDGRYKCLWEGDDLLPNLAKFKRIILATDGDKAGYYLREDLALRLGVYRCDFVEWPKGIKDEEGKIKSCKDANDVLCQYGVERLRNVISKAKPYLVDTVCSFSDIPNPGPSRQYGSGWDCLAPHLRLVRPELIIITGEPSAGKSEFAKNLVCNLAEIYRLKTVIASFEENPKPRLERDFRRMWLRKDWSGATIVERDECDAWIEKYIKLIIRKPGVDCTLNWLISRTEYAVKRYEVGSAVWDPWNEIDHRREPGQTETEYTGQSLTRLKALSSQLGIMLAIIAHPGKEGMINGLYSISGSAHWRNKSDHGIILRRENLTSARTEVDIARCKDYETMGVPGKVDMFLNRATGRFEPFEPDAEARNFAHD